MDRQTIHKTVDITYKVRPKRVCFVVRDGDFEALKQAVRIACFSWGGFYSTFLITKDNNGLTDGQMKSLRIFDPDELVIMSNSDGSLLQKYRKLGMSVISSNNLSNAFASPIGVLINTVLLDSDKKTTQPNENKPKLMVPSYPEDAFVLGYLLKYGQQMDDQEEDRLLNAFQLPRTAKLNTYFNIENPAMDNQFRPYIDLSLDRLAQIEGEYVYDLPSLTKFRTLWRDSHPWHQDEEFHDSSESSDDSKSQMIFVLSKVNNSFDDFALAWNIQSKRPFFNLPISPFPVLIPDTATDDDITYAIDGAKEIVSRLHIPINAIIYITSASFTAEELVSKAQQFGATPFSPDDISLLRKEFTTGEEAGGYGFSNGDFVRVTTPKFDNLDFSMGNYAIDFSGEGIVPPRNQNVRNYFPYSNFHGRTSNFGVTQIKSVGVRSAYDQKIALSSPTAFEILKGYMMPHKVTAELSESGKTGSLAKLLLNDELFHELKIISNERIFKLLEKMKKIKGRSLYTRYWKQSTGPMIGEIEQRLGAATAANVQTTLDDIHFDSIARLEKDINEDREFLTFTQIQSALQTTPKITTRILEWCLDNHILERRASIDCRICGQSILLRLDQIGHKISCPKCFKEFNFVNPQGEISWLYRETDSWAELQTSDVLPSLLTLLYLEFKEADIGFTPLVGGWTGMDYSFTEDDESEFKAEVDITAFVYRELVLGESKNKSSEFITLHGKEQIERMVKLAKRLEVEHLIFSSIDICSAPTRKEIASLTKSYGYEGKLIFCDKKRLFNQEAGHILPTDNAASHLTQTVDSYLSYWEKKRKDSIY